jgi:hypothetical protein
MAFGEGFSEEGSSARRVWLPAVTASIGCGRTHERAGGRFDETARRLSHEELFVAQVLASEGHDVTALGERRHGGSTADLLVCGRPLEVKSWLSQEERGGSSPRRSSVVNKLLHAEAQAPAVVLNARGSGLTAAVAVAGMADYARLRRPTAVSGVRVLGDGFDLGWTQHASVWRRPELGVRPVDDRGRWRPSGPNQRDLGAGP